MRVLLINPKFPPTYSGFQYALPFVRRKCFLPPLSLITVASLLPKDWTCRLVDLNGEALCDEDIRWADVVMLTGMIVQKDSLDEVLSRCKQLGTPTVVGGPYATSLPHHLNADHVVIGEAEDVMSTLTSDLISRRAQPFYQENGKPDITSSPIPRFDLLTRNFYYQMSIQYSRGCPYNCEFCDIIIMYGKKPRTKTPDQLIRELEAIRATGFSGEVFLVDDNFIANKKAAKKMLPEIASWRRRTQSPLEFYTQVSMDLADDPTLVTQMTQAGFTKVFIGIETPSKEALRETGKMQNLKGDMVKQVHGLLQQGLLVAGGFILGFDKEGSDIFDNMVQFIHRAGMPYAMVGLLGALPNTALFRRLEKEGRLRSKLWGDQFTVTNIVPRMPLSRLIRGYEDVLRRLYSPEEYFTCCKQNLTLWKPPPGSKRALAASDIFSALRLFWSQGICGPYRRLYWQFIFWSLFHYPAKFPLAIRLAAAGHHFITYTREIAIPSLHAEMAAVNFQETK